MLLLLGVGCAEGGEGAKQGQGNYLRMKMRFPNNRGDVDASEPAPASSFRSSSGSFQNGHKAINDNASLDEEGEEPLQL